MKYKILNHENKIEVEDNSGVKYPELSFFLSSSKTWVEILYEILTDIHKGLSIAEANPAHANEEEPNIVIFDETEVDLGLEKTSISINDGEKETYETNELRLLLEVFLKK
jgi:hypothetical protein